MRTSGSTDGGSEHSEAAAALDASARDHNLSDAQCSPPVRWPVLLPDTGRLLHEARLEVPNSINSSSDVIRRHKSGPYTALAVEKVFTKLDLSMTAFVMCCSQDVVRLRATLPDGVPADRRGWPAALSSQDNPFEAMVRIRIRVRLGA